MQRNEVNKMNDITAVLKAANVDTIQQGAQKTHAQSDYMSVFSSNIYSTAFWKSA